MAGDFQKGYKLLLTNQKELNKDETIQSIRAA